MSTNRASKAPSDGDPTAQIVRTVEALPPLPVIALRVMQVVHDPKSSAADLALVISADPALSAKMLAIVNSAAYRRTNEITSVQQALVMLGFAQARNIALSTAITSSYAPDALNALFRIDAFWRHSLVVAFRASDLAGKGKRANVDAPSAFTAGILHNMGRLAMFFADPAGVDQAVARVIAEGVSLEDAEHAELGIDHAVVGGLLAQKWRLPQEVQAAIAGHHGEGTDVSTLAGMLHEADHFAIGHGVLPGYVAPDIAHAGPDSHHQDSEIARILRQVDTMMDLVRGTPVAVRVA